MKKIKLGLFPKVVIAIVIGALLGLILPDVAVRILKTFNVLFAQLLKFVVPLLVLGLVTPSIANLGRGAGKMLLTVMALAYCSTVCGALFSYGISSNIFPLYLSPGELSAAAVSEKEFLPYIDPLLHKPYILYLIIFFAKSKLSTDIIYNSLHNRKNIIYMNEQKYRRWEYPPPVLIIISL